MPAGTFSLIEGFTPQQRNTHFHRLRFSTRGDFFASGAARKR